MTTFATVLGQLGNGTTHAALDKHMREVVKAVSETGKEGQVTLTLKVRRNAGTIMIVDEIKVKKPEDTRGATIFFEDEEGALHRRDPKQAEMFKDVSTKEVVNPETGEVTVRVAN